LCVWHLRRADRWSAARRTGIAAHHVEPTNGRLYPRVMRTNASAGRCAALPTLCGSRWKTHVELTQALPVLHWRMDA